MLPLFVPQWKQNQEHLHPKCLQEFTDDRRRHCLVAVISKDSLFMFENMEIIKGVIKQKISVDRLR